MKKPRVNQRVRSNVVDIVNTALRRINVEATLRQLGVDTSQLSEWDNKTNTITHIPTQIVISQDDGQIMLEKLSKKILEMT